MQMLEGKDQKLGLEQRADWLNSLSGDSVCTVLAMFPPPKYCGGSGVQLLSRV